MRRTSAPARPTRATAERRRLAPLAGLALGAAAAAAWFGLRGPRLPTAAAPLAVVAAARQRPSERFAADTVRARSIESNALRQQAFGAALQRWLAADFDAAAAYVRALPPSPEATEALLTVLEFRLHRDPWGALELAREWATPADAAACFSEIFSTLGRINAQRAAEAWTGQSPGAGRTNGLRALLDAWSARDWQAAWKWVQSPVLADPTEREAAIAVVVRRLAQSDPLQAVTLAERSLSGDALGQALAPAIRGLETSDLARAAQLIARLPAGAQQQGLAVESASRWAASDPAGALQWSLGLPEPARAAAMVGTLNVWAADNPAGAAAAVSAIDSEGLKAAAANAVAERLGAEAAQGHGERVAAMRQPGATAVFASAWASRDPAGAAMWSAGLPAGAERDAALAGALSYLFNADAAGARDFVGALEAPKQIAGAAEVSEASAQQNPAATVAWAEELPPGAARTAALTAAATTWATYTPGAAASWASGLPPGMDRDQAVAAVALRYAVHSPEEAMSLATTITDPTLRTSTLEVLTARQ